MHKCAVRGIVSDYIYALYQESAPNIEVGTCVLVLKNEGQYAVGYPKFLLLLPYGIAAPGSRFSTLDRTPIRFPSHR